MSGSAPKIEWFLARDGQQYGPITDAELKKVIELGHLRAEDLIWRAGFAEWRVANDIFPERFIITPPALPEAAQPAATENTSPEVTAAQDPQASQPQHHRHADEAPEPVHEPVHEPTHATPKPSHGNEHAAAAPGRGTEPGHTIERDTIERDRTVPVGRSNVQGRHADRAGTTRHDAFTDPNRGTDRDQTRVDPHRRQPQERPHTDQQQTYLGPRPGAPFDDAAPYNAPHNAPDKRPRSAEFDPRNGPGPGNGGRDLPRNDRNDGRRPDLSLDPHANPHADPRARQRPVPANGPQSDPAWPATPADLRPPAKNVASHRDAYNPELDPDLDDDDGFAPPRQRSFVAMAAMSLVLAGIAGGMGTAGWWIYTNPADAAKLYKELTGDKKGSKPVIVPAPRTATREPATTTTTLRPAGATPTVAKVAPVIDLPFLRTPLWQRFEVSFPIFARDLRAEVARRNARQAPASETNIFLVNAIVTLRRNNAPLTLSAPPAALEAIAASFVANLKFLTAQSIGACYGFISQGELNPTVLPIFSDPTAAGPLPTQSIAIFNAIEASKKSKTAYDEPTKADFDALSQQLVKRGWTRKDLQLFSDPAALSKAPHDQVCRLVTEWFETQLTITDPARKMRLLAASLSPVVSG